MEATGFQGKEEPVNYVSPGEHWLNMFGSLVRDKSGHTYIQLLARSATTTLHINTRLNKKQCSRAKATLPFYDSH